MFLNIRAIPRKVAIGVLAPLPRADGVFKAIFASPMAWSSVAGELPKAVLMMPTLAAWAFLELLAIGVWQQAVYQRKRPLSLKDR